MAQAFYPGRRLSSDGFLCTVRYVGSLSGVNGEWLGVEWDGATRGKHDGRHRESRIFQCLSDAPSAASFVRSSRKFDPEQTVIEAITSKYGNAGDSSRDAVVISGKVAEEVGFDKIAQEQARLADLRIVLIDQMVVNGIARRNASTTEVRQAQEELRATCPNITELDLGWNTFESFTDVALVCAALPKLKVLKIGGSRFSAFDVEESGQAFSNLTQLSLQSCLIQPGQLAELLGSATSFASLQQLDLSDNGLTEVPKFDFTESLSQNNLGMVDLSNNQFSDLSCVASLTNIFPFLHSISFQGNHIEQLGDASNCAFTRITTLNLSQNNIPSFKFVDAVPDNFPNLESLHITQNPFFTIDRATAAEDPKATDKKFYLTIARVQSLKILNYTKISARDREEGEIYYLSVADDAIKKLVESATDRSRAVQDAKKLFLRYDELAKRYGNETLDEKYLSDKSTTTEQKTQTVSTTKYPAGSLGARIVTATFYMSGRDSDASITMKFPSSIPVTRIMALLVQNTTFKGQIKPLSFRLIYESSELDPVDSTTDSTTRSATYGRKLTLEQKRALWQEWGDWDADSAVKTLLENEARDPGSEDQQSRDGDEHWIEDGKICIKDGRRFKPREVEIPPALKRPWGDWLEGSKEVRIRIEPYQRSLSSD